MVLASAVYVTGTTRLQPGYRYIITVRGSRLQILGPSDVDPDRVVLDRPIDAITASALEGRLILSEPRTKSGPVLAFMAVAGLTPSDLAIAIREAASQSLER